MTTTTSAVPGAAALRGGVAVAPRLPRGPARTPASARPSRGGAVAAAGHSGVSRERWSPEFTLLVLLNATLFIRPTEIVPALLGLPIYEVLILSCLVVAARRVFGQLSWHSLKSEPVTLLVVGMLVACVLSHLSHFSLYGARVSAISFSKVLLFYLLVVGVVRTGGRLRQFLFWLAVFTCALTALALLQYHGAIDVPALTAYAQREHGARDEAGGVVVLARLVSTGIFNDPNDLCLILVFGAMTCLYLAGAPGLRLMRPVWLAAAGMFLYALFLTYSRGGFLALVVSLTVLFVARFGWRKALPLGLLAIPVLVVLFGGRATSIDASGGTGQHRIQLWNEGFALFQGAPLFGIGQGEFVENVRLVAHNSFVHCYVELGVFGGTIFVGMFYYAMRSLVRLGKPDVQIHDPELRRLRPFLLATLAAYVTGFMSLSRSYTLTTYLMLGLAMIFLRLATTGRSVPELKIDSRFLGRLALFSTAFLVVLFLVARTLVSWE